MKARHLSDQDTVVARTDRVVTADVDGEIMMMSVEQGQYYGMNEVGNRIWQLIQQPRSVSDLCELLVAEFEVGPEACHTQVMELLNQLKKEQLLDIVDEVTG